MENRVVALSVLEDLAHWPLSTQLTGDSDRGASGSRTELSPRVSKSRSKEATLAEGALGSHDAVAASNAQMPPASATPAVSCMAYDAEEEVTSEPVERKQARYAAVLLLPLLCQKLGPRWVQSEVVPYLLRCLEEEDARLGMAVGVTVLGLVLPRTVGSTLYPLYTTTANASSATNNNNISDSGKAEADKHAAPSSTSSSCCCSYLTLDAVQPVLVALSCSREESLRHFVAQVIVPHVCFGLALRQPPDDLLQSWDTAYLPPPGLQEAGWGADTTANTNTGVNSTAVPTEESTCEHDERRAAMHEAWDFLCSPTHATLRVPHTLRMSANTCSSSSCSSVLCSTRPTEASTGQGSGLLEHASLDLYGAAYARNRQGLQGGDRFALMLQARALRHDMHQWLTALAIGGKGEDGAAEVDKAAATLTLPTQSKPSPSTPTSSHAPQKDTMMRYFDSAVRREALRLRWKFWLKLLRVLLETPCASANAVAVESIGAVVQALTWYRTSMAAGQAEQATRHADPHAENNSLSHSNEEEPCDVWSCFARVMQTAQPRDESELRSFTYASVRGHVALAVAAAVAPTHRVHSILQSKRNNNKKSNALLMPLIVRALATAQGALMSLLYEHRILLETAGETNAAQTMWGCGPAQLLAHTHSIWDVCLTAAYNEDEDDEEDEEKGESEVGSGAVVEEANVTTATSTTSATQSLSRPADAPPPPRTPLHRLTCVAVVQALPRVLHWAPLPSPKGTYASRAGSSEREGEKLGLALGETCRLLRRVLVPPSLWPLYAQKKYDTTKAGDDGSKMRAEEDGKEDEEEGMQLAEESMASSDYGIVAATLRTMQQLSAQLALWLPSYVHTSNNDAASVTALLGESTQNTSLSSPPSSSLQLHVIERCTDELWGLMQTGMQLVPRYAAWKARWALAVALPGLIASYVYLLVRLHESLACAKSGECEGGAAAVSSLLQARLTRVMTALTEAYSPPAANKQQQEQQNASGSKDASRDAVTPRKAEGLLRACAGPREEEIEVRVVALKAAASVIAALVQGTLRLAAAAIATADDDDDDDQIHTSQGTHYVIDHTRARGRAGVSCVQATWTTLEPLVRQVYSLCQDSLGDGEEQVRSAAVVAVAGLTRSLISIEKVTAGSSRPSLRTLRQSGVELLSRAAAADRSSAVQLVLVAELTEVLLAQTSQDTITYSGQKGNEAEKNSAPRSPHEVGPLAALLDGLRALGQHEMWRFRERYAWLLGHLCLRCLCLAGWPHMTSAQGNKAANASNTIGSSNDDDDDLTPEAAGRLVNEELLPLLVTVLFDKVKAVRDAALRATAQLCRALNAAEEQQHAEGGVQHATTKTMMMKTRSSGVRLGENSQGSFASAQLWPLLEHDAKAWQTYLSRTALLHIATTLGMDKTTIVMPLLVQLAQDAVPNVRLAVAKTLRSLLRRQLDICEDYELSDADNNNNINNSGNNSAVSVNAAMSWRKETHSGGGDGEGKKNEKTSSSSSSNNSNKKVQSCASRFRARTKAEKEHAIDIVAPLVFTEAEKDGVVLALLRQLLADKSGDVRDEAAEALRVCF